MQDGGDHGLGPGVIPAHLSDHFGDATIELVNQAFNEGIERGVLLMRHSARFFDRNINDLENPLTDHGRRLSQKMGAGLDKQLQLRGYSSPAHRCVETAELILAEHSNLGGTAGRTRPVEALGVFYALDQRKLWKGMSLAPSLPDYVAQWFADQVPADAMIPAQQAMRLLLRVLAAKLNEAQPGLSLDVCVSHDFTLFALREAVGLEPLDGPTVEFLDGLILFRRPGMKDDRAIMRSHHGGEVELSLADL